MEFKIDDVIDDLEEFDEEDYEYYEESIEIEWRPYEAHLRKQLQLAETRENLSEYESFKFAQRIAEEFYYNDDPRFTGDMLFKLRYGDLTVYNELLDTDTSMMFRILMNCSEVELVQNYMDRLAGRDLIADFEMEHRLYEEDADDMLLHIINISYENELDDYVSSLYCFGDYCKNLFSENFLCDVAVITAIWKLRDVTHNGYGRYCAPWRVDFTSHPRVSYILSDLRKGLRSYLTEEYTLNRVVKTMVMYCGSDKTESDLEYYEMIQPCDDFVLEEVLHYMKSILKTEEFYFDTSELHHILTCWQMKYKDTSCSDNYEKAWLGIRRLIDWIYENSTQ